MLTLNHSGAATARTLSVACSVSPTRSNRLIDAQIDGLIKEFQIELRLDPAKYERDLRVIDQRTNRFGFFPKLETKAEQKVEPKK